MQIVGIEMKAKAKSVVRLQRHGTHSANFYEMVHKPQSWCDCDTDGGFHQSYVIKSPP